MLQADLVKRRVGNSEVFREMGHRLGPNEVVKLTSTQNSRHVPIQLCGRSIWVTVAGHRKAENGLFDSQFRGQAMLIAGIDLGDLIST